MDIEYKKKVDKVNRKLNFFSSADSDLDDDDVYDNLNQNEAEVNRAKNRLLRRSRSPDKANKLGRAGSFNESSTITVPDLTIKSIKSGENSSNLEEKDEPLEGEDLADESQLKDIINNTHEFENILKKNGLGSYIWA